MPPQTVSESAVPAITLPSQHLHRLGNLSPRHRIRHKSDFAGTAPLVRKPFEPQHQLHILADGVVEVPAGAQHRFASEQTKSAGDDDVAPQAVPSESAEQESPQILDDLHAGERVDRNAGP